jgi:hypothetical protein
MFPAVNQLPAEVAEHDHAAEADEIDGEDLHRARPVSACKEDRYEQEDRKNRSHGDFDPDGEQPGPTVEVLPIHETKKHCGEDPDQRKKEAVAGSQNESLPPEDGCHHGKDQRPHYQPDRHMDFRRVDRMGVTEAVKELINRVEHFLFPQDQVLPLSDRRVRATSQPACHLRRRIIKT